MTILLEDSTQMWDEASAPLSVESGYAPAASRAAIGNLIANWRAYDLDGQADLSAVASWSDRSATPKALTQGIVANQPTLVKNVMNGKSVVRFDATTERLEYNFVPTTLMPFTVVIVFQTGAGRGTPKQLWQSAAVEAIISSSNYRQSWGGTAIIAGGAVVVKDKPEISTFYFNQSYSSILTDGVLQVQGPYHGLGGLNGLWRVGDYSSVPGTRPFDGDIAEILVYTGLWTAEQNAQLDTILEAEYGIRTFDYIGGPGIEFTADFEGYIDGTQISAVSSGFTNGAFSAQMTHSTLQAIRGTRSMRILNPTAITAPYLAIKARAVSYQRFYFRYEVNGFVTGLVSARTGAIVQADININSNATLRIRDSLTVVGTSTIVLTPGQWYRLEYKVDMTTGIQTLRIYGGADLHTNTVTEEITGACASATTHDRLYLGTTSGVTADYFFDAYASAVNDWIGPV